MSTTQGRFRTCLALTIVSGAVMVASPFVGLVGTMVGMARSLQAMEGSRAKDPEVLSQHIGEVLISTATGYGVALLGLPVFVMFLAMTVREGRRGRRMAAVKQGLDEDATQQSGIPSGENNVAPSLAQALQETGARECAERQAAQGQ